MVDDIHNTTRLWMREPDRKREAMAVLDTILPPDMKRYMYGRLSYPPSANTYPDSVLVGRVRWDYAELYDWMKYLNSSMRDLSGVKITAWGIDATAGRLFFGIETEEMVPKMESWLAVKGIPCHLVVLQVMGEAHPA